MKITYPVGTLGKSLSCDVTVFLIGNLNLSTIFILSASNSFVRILPRLLKNERIFIWSQSITDLLISILPRITVSPNNWALPCDTNVLVLSNIKVSDMFKFASKLTSDSISKSFSNLVFLWKIICSDVTLFGNVAIRLLVLVVSLFSLIFSPFKCDVYDVFIFLSIKVDLYVVGTVWSNGLLILSNK